jgi:hypothetical protein
MGFYSSFFSSCKRKQYFQTPVELFARRMVSSTKEQFRFGLMSTCLSLLLKQKIAYAQSLARSPSVSNIFDLRITINIVYSAIYLIVSPGIKSAVDNLMLEKNYLRNSILLLQQPTMSAERSSLAKNCEQLRAAI